MLRYQASLYMNILNFLLLNLKKIGFILIKRVTFFLDFGFKKTNKIYYYHYLIYL